MRRIIIVFWLLLPLLLLGGCKEKKGQESGNVKPALMWFDAEANFERFSTPDSIDYYLTKIKSLGFTHAVVDVRPITGEVLFDTEFAPKMKEWNGYERKDFDYLGHFIEKAHALGLEVHASLNVFVAGHNYFDRGLVYSDHPEWASTVYTPRGLISITKEKRKYSAMVNPVNEEFQIHILNVLKDLVRQYPALDGLILDRVRYDGITSDFLSLSQEKFEAYIGQKMARFPEDIFEWQLDEDNKKYTIVRGKHFNKWIEWRAGNIYNFMSRARQAVKDINPSISFGTYTGAWYPSYYEVGVNFASRDYDPSKDYDWATPEYKNFGYAELLDLYTTGNYYTDITIEEYKKTNHSVWNETDSEAQSGTWYCVEGSCHKLRQILGNNKFIGGILVDQFYETPEKLSATIEMNLKESDGLMVFDIVHIIHKNLWKEVEAGMRAGKALK